VVDSEIIHIPASCLPELKTAAEGILILAKDHDLLGHHQSIGDKVGTAILHICRITSPRRRTPFYEFGSKHQQIHKTRAEIQHFATKRLFFATKPQPH
jgi:hypothetical protein